MGRLPRTALAASLLWIAACSTGPVASSVASWQGARLYASGSRALDQGDTRRAIADLEAAAVRVPHASEIQNHLGLAYAAADRRTDALAAFERAVALDCDNAQAAHNLATARAAPGPAGAATPGATR